MEESSITPELLETGGILRNFEDTPAPEITGKKTILKYNKDLQIIEYVFEDIPKNELPLPDRLRLLEEMGDKIEKILEERFKDFESQINLTQEGILELMDRIGGGLSGLFRNN